MNIGSVHPVLRSHVLHDVLLGTWYSFAAECHPDGCGRSSQCLGLGDGIQVP